MKAASLLLVLLLGVSIAADAEVVIGESGASCAQDDACTNRFHPEIPMVASAEPGERIIMKGKNARDLRLVSTDQVDADRFASAGPSGIAHPLVGPVYINGAQSGDVLAVTIENIDPGPIGWTSASPFGFAADAVGIERRFILWRLNNEFAETDALPGVRIPNASFPGVIATMPDGIMLSDMLEREANLAEAGGAVLLPDTDSAQPSSLCGEEGSRSGECLRTIPPRENGGNMDIRYLKVGTTVYLPCNIDGCGLSIGDFHYAQGDGEVSGTAIEMDADISVTTRVMRDGPDLTHGPHYSGPATLLDIPSTNFYATTGYPLKRAGQVPRDIEYLANAKAAALTNLSRDINLAAQNALVSMIDYITATYGYDRTQAYMIASVAVDLRIAQLVDVPNVGVTAILPLDIFVGD